MKSILFSVLLTYLYGFCTLKRVFFFIKINYNTIISDFQLGKLHIIQGVSKLIQPINMIMIYYWDKKFHVS